LFEKAIAKTEAALSSINARIEAAEDLAALAAQPEGTTLEQLYQHREAQAAELRALEKKQAARLAEIEAEHQKPKTNTGAHRYADVAGR
jgi:hypothetical protein